MRGITFEIPNAYGRYLFEILHGIDIHKFTWKVGDGEAYYVENNTLKDSLFLHTYQLNSMQLFREISKEDYYLIFADLKGFPIGGILKEINTYQDFVESDCQFVLLVVDSSYVTIYSKNKNTIKQLFSNAENAGYKNISYITDENDQNSTLVAF